MKFEVERFIVAPGRSLATVLTIDPRPPVPGHVSEVPSSDQPAVTRSRLAGRGGDDAARSSKATVSVLELEGSRGYTFGSPYFCLRRKYRP